MNINKTMLDETVNGIVSIAGGLVTSVILYGSAARGTADSESDIDIAVILSGALAPEKNDALLDFVVEMNLKYNKVFSVIDISDEEFTRWKDIVPFYKNVAGEGVVLWKAA